MCFNFRFRTFKTPGHLADTPVIIGIFQRACHTFVDTCIAGNIAQRIVELPSRASRCTDFRMTAVCCLQHSLVEWFPQPLWRHPFHDGISHHRSRIISHHAVPMSRRSPFGQKSAFEKSVEQTFLNLRIAFGIDQIEQWEEAAEGIPHSRVRVHWALMHFSIIGTTMDHASKCVEFVETSRKKR